MSFNYYDIVFISRNIYEAIVIIQFDLKYLPIRQYHNILITEYSYTL